MSRMPIFFRNRIIVASVHMPCPPGGKEHLDPHHCQASRHGDETRHGRVAPVPKPRKAWICKGDEGRWEEMDERCCDQDSRPKVS